MSAAQYRGEGTESEWRSTVKDAALHLGWVVALELPDAGLGALHALANNPRKPRRSLIPFLAAISGWPDLTLGHPGRGELIFVELKTTTGRVRPNQGEMIALLRSCGARVYVWRTGDPEMLSVLSGV